MADQPANQPQQQQQQTSSWWGGFLDTVKASTQSIVNMYKEDLSEFGRTVASDTKKFVSDVSKKVEDVSKQDPSTLASSVTSKIAGSVTGVATGIKSLVSTLATTVGAASSPSQSTEKQPDKNSSSILLDLQTTATFEKSPEDAEFEQWLNDFNVESKKDEITSILANNQQIFELYQQLVPSSLSPKEFWGRYFFRVAKMQEKESRRQEMLRKAQQLAEEVISWDDEPDTQQEFSPNSSEEKIETKAEPETDVPRTNASSGESISLAEEPLDSWEDTLAEPAPEQATPAETAPEQATPAETAPEQETPAELAPETPSEPSDQNQNTSPSEEPSTQTENS